MPRTARASQGGYCYHVINRGNARQKVFRKQADFESFVQLIHDACDRIDMRVVAYCVMPNHFHLALWPHEDGDLGRWMQWLLTAHVRRYHRHYGTSGHVWQGRFKAFPIQKDEHLLTVLRYIERNPVRANLVASAEEWRWSSARLWTPDADRGCLHAGPVPRPSGWLKLVNRPLTAAELSAVRTSVNRGRPYGTDRWSKATAGRLGLEFTLNPRGRPRNAASRK
jgi:putative transposase